MMTLMLVIITVMLVMKVTDDDSDVGHDDIFLILVMLLKPSVL